MKAFTEIVTDSIIGLENYLYYLRYTKYKVVLFEFTTIEYSKSVLVTYKKSLLNTETSFAIIHISSLKN